MSKKTALISGANRGIGLAIVKNLANDKNIRVILGCRDINQGISLAKQIGSNVSAAQINLENRRLLSAQIKDIKDKFDNVDILVNNAAVLNKDSFLDIPMEKFDEVLRSNLIGAYELIRAFISGMIKNNFGRIVNISSGWGSFDEGLRGPFSYSVTKAALNAMTMNLAEELPPNVKINSLCPGWVNTRMGGKTAPRSPDQAADDAVWLINLSEDAPSGKFFRNKKIINW